MNAEHASNQDRSGPAPATAQVISLGEIHGDAAHRSAPAAAPVVDNVNPLHAVRARLQVCVGEVELSVGELLAAKEHQVLVLDRAIDQPVDMLLEGKVVARGQLVAVDGSFAVRITELPAPLKA
jgi:flagellar motor switch protein FliN